MRIGRRGGAAGGALGAETVVRMWRLSDTMGAHVPFGVRRFSGGTAGGGGQPAAEAAGAREGAWRGGAAHGGHGPAGGGTSEGTRLEISLMHHCVDPQSLSSILVIINRHPLNLITSIHQIFKDLSSLNA